MSKANGLPGVYVVLDGIIGCGKSTQIKELKKHLPLDFPQADIVFTYEPGGNPEADLLRQKLKYEKMLPEDEAKLFVESRSITLPKIVVPVLERGGIIISDRNLTTSFAYQAFGRELGIDKVWQINKAAVNGIFPDIVFYMNIGRKACFKRSGSEDPDKFDAEDVKFWDRTIKGYSEMIKFLKQISPETRVIQVNDLEGKLPIEETRQVIKRELYPILGSYLGEGRIIRDRQV